MARAKRIIYNGNANGPDDFIPIVGGVANHVYPGGVRIPWWQGVDWRPTSAMTSNSAPSPFVVTRSSVYNSSYEALIHIGDRLSNTDIRRILQIHYDRHNLGRR